MSKLGTMLLEVFVIAFGCFAASAVNAAFATGGVHLTLAASSAVLPLSAAIPMQVALNATSLLARIVTCWRHINWSIFLMFAPAAAIGAVLGARVFVSMEEGVISLCLGLLLLILIWGVPRRATFRLPNRFALIGGAHGFLSTIFGVGLFLQPAVLRTDMARLQITGTLAACIMALEVVKAGGYAAFGFDFTAYMPHILAGAAASIVGNAAGHRLGAHVSEERFRLVFKLIVTLVGIRLLIKGVLLLGA